MTEAEAEARGYRVVKASPFEVGLVKGEYVIRNGEITCLRCGRTSPNPHDVENRYCGNCHDFLDGCDRGVRTWWANTFDRKMPALGHPEILQAVEIFEDYLRHVHGRTPNP